MNYISRKIEQQIGFSLKNNPVVCLNGPRQAGKSTFARRLIEQTGGSPSAAYRSLDDMTQAALAHATPREFLTRHDGLMVVDEVQLVPEIARAIKMVVDEMRLADKARSYGRFLLTGSTKLSAFPELSNALVGRMAEHNLYPLSAYEAFGGKWDFISALFAADFPPFNETAHGNGGTEQLLSAMHAATFPEISASKDIEGKARWLEDYATQLLRSELRADFSDEKFQVLPGVLKAVAAQPCQPLNKATVARAVGLNAPTCNRCLEALQKVYLLFEIPAWRQGGAVKRLAKAPKMCVADTMQLCALLGVAPRVLRRRNPQLFAHVVENFVAGELGKLLSFSGVKARLLHFRTSDNTEVDFVLERGDGAVAGIEVNASENVSPRDFRGLKVLRDLAGDKFTCGIVLYAGSTVVPAGPNFFAVPFQALWR